MKHHILHCPFLVTQVEEPDFYFRLEVPKWKVLKQYWRNTLFIALFSLILPGAFFWFVDPPSHLIREFWTGRLLFVVMFPIVIFQHISRLWSKAYQEFRIADSFLRITTSSHWGHVVIKEFELSEIESLHEKIDFVAVYIKLRHEKKAREMFRYPLESRHKEELTKLLALRLELPLIHEKRHFFRIKGNVWS